MSSIWVVGSAAVLASVAANLIIRAIAVPALDISDEFMPMEIPRIVFFTVIGTGAGVVAFHFIRQRASRPARTFIIVAVAALAGSYAPNLFLLFAGSQEAFPGLTDSAVATLMFMHLAAAVITVGTLVWWELRGNG